MYCATCNRTFSNQYFKKHLQTKIHNEKLGKHPCASCSEYIPNAKVYCTKCDQIQYSIQNPCKYCSKGYHNGVHTKHYDNLHELSGAYCGNCIHIVQEQYKIFITRLAEIPGSMDPVQYQQAKTLIKMQLEINKLKQLVVDLQLQNIELQEDYEDKISGIKDYVKEELRCCQQEYYLNSSPTW